MNDKFGNLIMNMADEPLMFILLCVATCVCMFLLGMSFGLSHVERATAKQEAEDRHLRRLVRKELERMEKR